jgi:hypothetical protein
VMFDQPGTAVSEAVPQRDFIKNLPVEGDLVASNVIAGEGQLVEEIEANQDYLIKTNT